MIDFKMGMNFSLIFLTIFVIVVKSNITGVAEKDLHLYEVSQLTCPSTGKSLTAEMINDGRCDCPEDGFDEPGTAACEKGRFYCKNGKNLDIYIPSFKVNDGVCDCCDGSDEYLNDHGVNCENTCDSLFAMVRKEKYLEKAKIKRAQNYYEKSKIEAELKQQDMKQKLEEINVKINELNEKAKQISDSTITTSAGMESFLQEYREKIDQLEILISNFSDATESADDSEFSDEPATEKSSWSSLIEMKLKRAKDIISKFSKVTTIRPTVTITKYLPTIVTKTVVHYETTGTYEDRIQDLDYEKEELLIQAREIEESINNDKNIFGPDSVFLPLKGKCFDKEEGEFTYSLCWFTDARQGKKNQTKTILGKWTGKWGKKADDTNQNSNASESIDFKKMMYSDGQWCGSRARETEVILECGWKDQLLSVEEPSKCFYQLKFSTPIACLI